MKLGANIYDVNHRRPLLKTFSR